MSRIFLATLGERPSAITVALDKLLEQEHYEKIIILHTNIEASHALNLAKGLQQLKQVLSKDYTIPVHYREISHADGSPLLDTDNPRSARDYYETLVDWLYEYQVAGYHQHLLVAGGRKAMTVYATLAAGTLFDYPHDKVWTVTSPPQMVNAPEQFHIPVGWREQVSLLDFPLINSRLAPGSHPRQLSQERRSKGETFLAKLSPSERLVAETLAANPYDSNETLALRFGKSTSTLENQLNSIYRKMLSFFVMDETLTSQAKRQILIDIVQRR